MEIIETNDRPVEAGTTEKDKPDGWAYPSNSEITEQEDIFSIIERMDGLYVEFERSVDNILKTLGV